VPDVLRKSLTKLSEEDRVTMTPLFSDRSKHEWPQLARRVLRALHLPQQRKFELCWEEYNLLDCRTRDRCFQILSVPGLLPVALDNPLGRGISHVAGWIPTSWIMRPLDRHIITPVVKAAVAPATALIADLPQGADRNKDARAWRDVLALAPTRIISLGIRAVLLDVSLDLLPDPGVTDTTAASSYDADPALLAPAGHPFAQFQAALDAAHAAADVPVMQQVTLAFQPLFDILKTARGHGLIDGTGYVDDVVRVAHQSMASLPVDVKKLVLDAGGLASLPWDEEARAYMTIDAF